ncbi:hypothetical protein HY523_02005 [Candidatus Berkelbacteria bacterium]|nr:hypothetical protein [Candidatus Berkelbacteria bacterium]
MRDRLTLVLFAVLAVVVVVDNVWQVGIVTGLTQPFTRGANELVLSPEERDRIKRDQQRIADLASIQNALERFIADHDAPPIPESYGEMNAWHQFDTSTEGRFLPFLVPDYLTAVPLDPINQGTDPVDFGYYYTYYPGTSDWGPGEHGRYFYVLGTKLENGQSNRFLDHEVGYWIGRELGGA